MKMQKAINVIVTIILVVLIFLPAVGLALPAWINIALGVAALVALILSFL